MATQNETNQFGRLQRCSERLLVRHRSDWRQMIAARNSKWEVGALVCRGQASWCNETVAQYAHCFATSSS